MAPQTYGHPSRLSAGTDGDPGPGVRSHRPAPMRPVSQRPQRGESSDGPGDGRYAWACCVRSRAARRRNSSRCAIGLSGKTPASNRAAASTDAVCLRASAWSPARGPGSRIVRRRRRGRPESSTVLGGGVEVGRGQLPPRLRRARGGRSATASTASCGGPVNRSCARRRISRSSTLTTPPRRRRAPVPARRAG